MHYQFFVVLLIIAYLNKYVQSDATLKKPTIVISILARNKGHTLPYFLSLLENLNYPKHRIALWIRSDHNIDNTIEILRTWLADVEHLYHSVDTDFRENKETFLPGEDGPVHWPPARFEHIIKLREEALSYAKSIWADYILAVDCDVFLTNSDTLQLLMDKGHTISAPMLKSDGLYSNFWYGMTEDYYYLRTDDYKPVLNRERIGCFSVPMVHSCVLIDLRKSESELVTYTSAKVADYNGPDDDIITFALSANRSNVSLNLCNDAVYGFVMVPLEQNDKLEHDLQQLTNIKLEILALGEPLPAGDLVNRFVPVPQKDTLGFDKVYMINLARRPERRRRMMLCFQELGLDVTALDAVDGRNLNDSVLKSITFLPEYLDPYHKRSMTLGEIGCFLSHYNIWKEVEDKGYETALVLEDDIRFEPFFRLKVQRLMTELQQIPDWDLVYFGRKRLQDSEEPWVEGSRTLVHASYSYWTLGYALSSRGARKLLRADPLNRLLPVDEYIPILFDKHPRDNWKGYFPKRDLVALSAAPLLLYPTHYTGEQGYISDTEDSMIVDKGSPPQAGTHSSDSRGSMEKLREDL